MAFRRDEIEDARSRHRADIAPEQRFGAGIGGLDAAVMVEHKHAIACRVEDGLELACFGFGGAQRSV